MKTTRKGIEEKSREVCAEMMAVALGKYIETLGGTALVVGGVSVGQKVGSLKYNYFVQIGITGRMPTRLPRGA